MAEPVHPERGGFGDADPIAPAWSIEREHVTGTTRMRMDSGWDTTLPDGGRTVGIKRLLLSVRDDDPASCRAEADAVAEIEHDGDTARAEARLVFACDRDVIDVVIEVRVTRRRRAVLGAGLARAVRSRPAVTACASMPGMQPGAYAALPTFFDADEAVDLAAIREHVVRFADAGPRRQPGLRSTGEFVALDEAQSASPSPRRPSRPVRAG